MILSTLRISEASLHLPHKALCSREIVERSNPTNNSVGSAIALVLLFAAGPPVQARDDKHLLPIKGALESTDAREKPDGSVRFFFAKQETPQIITRLGNDVVHRRVGTRPVDAEKACNTAFLLALADSQKRAKKLSANAVVNIISYYKKVEIPSAAEFECHAGSGAHVFLKGDLAKIAGE